MTTTKTTEEMKALAIEAELYSHNISHYTMRLMTGTLEKVFGLAEKVMDLGRPYGRDYTAMTWKRVALRGAYQALCATAEANRPAALVRKFIEWRDEIGARAEQFPHIR